MSEENTEQRGIIREVIMDGGLITLVMEQNGRRVVVRGDNGPTVRALMNVFGSDIVRHHMLDTEKIIGREIGWDTDDVGILAYITP